MSNKMKEFNMKDVHSGYVVKFRNNTYALVTRVGEKFTKIFALVEEKARVKDVQEGRDFFYTSAYKDNYHYAYSPISKCTQPDPDHDVVAVYGLMHGVNNYLYAGTSLIMNRLLLWEENIKEMTLEEVEKALGHKVKIVNNEPPTCCAELCSRCIHNTNHECGHIPCDECKAKYGWDHCKCMYILAGEPCPYFKGAEDESK